MKKGQRNEILSQFIAQTAAVIDDRLGRNQANAYLAAAQQVVQSETMGREKENERYFSNPH